MNVNGGETDEEIIKGTDTSDKTVVIDSTSFTTTRPVTITKSTSFTEIEENKEEDERISILTTTTSRSR